MDATHLPEIASLSEAALKGMIKLIEKKNADSATQQLLGSEEAHLNVVFTLDRIPENPMKRDKHIELPHNYRSNPSICFVVREPERTHRKFVEDQNIQGVDEIIGTTRFEKEYKQPKDKHLLFKKHDMFIFDTALMDFVQRIMGQPWFSTNQKRPIGVKVNKNLARTVSSVVGSAQFRIPKGNLCSVKIGHSKMSAPELAANLRAVCAAVLPHCESSGVRVNKVSICSEGLRSLPLWERQVEDENIILETDEKVKKKQKTEA